MAEVATRAAAPSPASQNLQAAGLVLGGIAAFCVNDVVVKTLTGALPPGEIMALRGVLVVAIMLAVLPRLGLAPGRLDRWAALRALAETATNGAFIASLRLLPLGDTYTL